MYFKTMHEKLIKCGWIVIDEAHNGDLIDHYFKYTHPSATIPDDCTPIELTAASKKDGTPGRITNIWQNGRKCRI